MRLLKTIRAEEINSTQRTCERLSCKQKKIFIFINFNLLSAEQVGSIE